jgi:hypothetical protein
MASKIAYGHPCLAIKAYRRRTAPCTKLWNSLSLQRSQGSQITAQLIQAMILSPFDTIELILYQEINEGGFSF